MAKKKATRSPARSARPTRASTPKGRARPAPSKRRRAQSAAPGKGKGGAKGQSLAPLAPPTPTLRLASFQVDAFTSRRFRGNPAAVVLVEDGWLADDLMQAIAAEHNLSETAFVSPKGGKGTLGIRWFTPTVEVDLCGHATLAAAHVLWNHVGLKGDRLVFSSRSGPLPVERLREAGRDLIVLDFPATPPKPVADAELTAALAAALGQAPVEVLRSRDLLAVFDNKRDVHELAPDMARLRDLGVYAVIATAPGAGHDFVSRFFAPRQGVDEDPVTGSAHCTLTPYWAKRLGKPILTAHQVSRRGGELFCEDRGHRVRIGGAAVTYLEGRISV